MRTTKSSEWMSRQGPDLENNSRRALYRPAGPNCRDTGRFVARVSEVDRFWSKVDLHGPAHPELGRCWVWIAPVNRYGYGRFARTTDHRVLAHRYAYELLVGPIPEGMTLDHLCERQACVRPSHLEPVSNAENVRRRHARRRLLNGATS